jgi:uncharacterized membrane protein
MVIFHFIWDLAYFGLYQANVLAGPWQLFARNIAATFIFVMGVSLTLSYHRVVQKTGHTSHFAKFLRRGAQIFGLGMLVTVATYFFIGRGFVIFGILHVIGLSIIAAYPFLGRSQWLSLVAGLVSIGVGLYLGSLVVSYPWLIPLGVKQSGRYMVDYYPFFSWFGVALLGIFAGKALYPAGVRRFNLPDWSDVAIVKGFRFLGRHSLLIYVTHQPVLIGMLILLGFGSF